MPIGNLMLTSTASRVSLIYLNVFYASFFNSFSVECTDKYTVRANKSSCSAKLIEKQISHEVHFTHEL